MGDGQSKAVRDQADDRPNKWHKLVDGNEVVAEVARWDPSCAVVVGALKANNNRVGPQKTVRMWAEPLLVEEAIKK